MHLPILSAQWAITARDGALAVKDSHSMGDGRIFLQSLPDASFNKDLSNEPTFAGLISLDTNFKGLVSLKFLRPWG